MKTASECIAGGFALATRRIYFVFLDTAAKLMWLAGSLLLVVLAMNWAFSRIAISAEMLASFNSGVPAIAGGALLSLLIAQRSLLLGTLLVAMALSILLWIGIEAFVRAGMLPVSGRSFVGDAFAYFPRYLAAGIIRRLTLFTAAILVGLVAMGPLLTSPIAQWGHAWPEVRFPALAGTGILAILALFLLFVDTIIRSDAWSAVADDLPKVAGVIGTLAFFELALIGSASGLVTVTLDIAGSGGLVVLVGGLSLAGLSVAHSYLLLVRYSAVGIMRREAECKLEHS